MPESHSHDAPKDFGGAFLLGIGLNSAFILAEVVAGFWSGSLALLADAGHNLADVLGLVMAWAAVLLARRAASERRTYGFRRSTILAALFNALLLLVGVGGIAWEAMTRIGHPDTVSWGVMAWVAGLGILVNGFTAWLFMSGRKQDLNVRGAFLHMAADAGVSLGVMVSGIVIALTGWVLLDPLVSLAIAVLILWSTWGLFRESVNLSMDAVPEGIDPRSVHEYLSGLPGVTSVHHVHIWALSTTETALTAHVVRSTPEISNAFLDEAGHGLRERFGIAHPTLQVETAPACDTKEC